MYRQKGALWNTFLLVLLTALSLKMQLIFFKILLLAIEDTDSDIDDFEIIITGTMADIIEGDDYTFWGGIDPAP